jgi:hypothetical protein
MSFLTTKAVALRTGLTSDAIRWNERHGRLLSIKVDSGHGHYQRLYLEDDVTRFIAERAKRAHEKAMAKAATKPVAVAE